MQDHHNQCGIYQVRGCKLKREPQASPIGEEDISGCSPPVSSIDMCEVFGVLYSPTFGPQRPILGGKSCPHLHITDVGRD